MYDVLVKCTQLWKRLISQKESLLKLVMQYALLAAYEYFLSDLIFSRHLEN